MLFASYIPLQSPENLYPYVGVIFVCMTVGLKSAHSTILQNTSDLVYLDVVHHACDTESQCKYTMHPYIYSIWKYKINIPAESGVKYSSFGIPPTVFVPRSFLIMPRCAHAHSGIR